MWLIEVLRTSAILRFQSAAFRLHFEEQEYYYGKQFLISLVCCIDWMSAST